MNAGVKIVVTGVVQGVGFRFFVMRIAENLGVTGRVRNRFDGSVEVEAEGTRSALEALIREVRIGPRMASIRGINVEWMPYEGKFKTFDLVF